MAAVRAGGHAGQRVCGDALSTRACAFSRASSLPGARTGTCGSGMSDSTQSSADSIAVLNAWTLVGRGTVQRAVRTHSAIRKASRCPPQRVNVPRLVRSWLGWPQCWRLLSRADGGCRSRICEENHRIEIARDFGLCRLAATPPELSSSEVQKHRASTSYSSPPRRGGRFGNGEGLRSWRTGRID